jgi:PhoH-like ATPase
VLEELDRAKKGVSEVASNARQASRFLAELIGDASKEQIDAGLILPGPTHGDANRRGRLFFALQRPRSRSARADTVADPPLAGGEADSAILAAAIALQADDAAHRVTLVTKDINLRIKAAVAGIHAEDFHNDQVLDDVDLLYRGLAELPADFWDGCDEVESWQQGGRGYYRLRHPALARREPNEGVYLADAPAGETLLVREINGARALLEQLSDHSVAKNAVWGISARNREQNFALNLLLDERIDFVSLLGAAGTGKTLLALAAGLALTLDERRYREIIMTRVTVSVGEDIGFLPGTEEEKMTPWMGALLDNLEVLTESQSGGEWGRAATQDLINNRVKIRSLNFMRGRTFQNKFLIIDEAQNLTAKQMKTLITRAGPGTKVVCLGNVSQIDTPYLSETTSGLTYVVDRFKRWPHSGHVTLLRGERSRLAEFASDSL